MRKVFSIAKGVSLGNQFMGRGLQSISEVLGGVADSIAKVKIVAVNIPKPQGVVSIFTKRRGIVVVKKGGRP